MDRNVIVFGNDHTNSVGVIQSIGKAGYNVLGLIFGENTGYVKSSRYTKGIIVGADPQSCIEKLLAHDFKSMSKIPIIPCCDIAALTLEENSKRLSKKFIFEHADNYSLRYLFIKDNQIKLACKSGFNVPKTWNLNNIHNLPKDITFPCLIKPIISCEGAKCDIRICRNSEDLHKNISSLIKTKHVILQQYIERDYEISILGCTTSTGTCILPAVEYKLTLYPKNVGLECLANMQRLEDPILIKKISDLISEIGYVGLFSVELMHCITDGKFYFTEFNLRNDGAESFVTKFGANLPLNHVEDLKGKPLTAQQIEFPGYYIWDMHHLKSLLCGDTSFFSWVSEIISSKGFLMYDKNDKKPFFRQYLYMLEKLFRLNKFRKSYE